MFDAYERVGTGATIRDTREEWHRRLPGFYFYGKMLMAPQPSSKCKKVATARDVLQRGYCHLRYLVASMIFASNITGTFIS